ncbi:MAG: glycoside hydrolase family 5 protein [Chloroflexota bacterium]|nr:glycoside hydrolase family 5 protein [Chloroflexota bacterium]
MSWKAVEPVQGGGYRWEALATFEQELLAAKQAGLRPMVVVGDSPGWATINVPYETSCGAIRADRFGDFANFMAALVTRYKQHPYNVRYWELGNEVDVDPRLVAPHSVYGCWGNMDDPYYGGEHYGNMLKVVTPAIRAADGTAKVLIGGLLLGTNHTADTSVVGRPEMFFEGVLRAGAAPYFDIVPYHGHSSYSGPYIDHSGSGGGWVQYGGSALGKPAFLREVMARYGVNKPLLFNEASLGCEAQYNQECAAPPPAFYQAQADHVPRMMIRTLNANVSGIIWYSLNDAKWRHGSLLDEHYAPKPSYWSYQTLINQVSKSRLPPQPVAYNTEGVEAYQFTKTSAYKVDVLWSVDGTPRTVALPQGTFIAAYDQFGSPLLPSHVNGNVQLTVGFSTVYIHRR